MLNENKYLLRKKIFHWLGEEFEVFDMSKNVVLFGKQKAFRLKEDIRVYDSKEKTHEVISLQARQIIDFSATYDVLDSESGKKVGALQRKGWSSIIRDEWKVLDANDNEIGHIKEDSMSMALLRRFLSNLIPQNLSIFIGEKEVCDLKQEFNPFVYKLGIEFKDEGFDKRLGVAAAILISLIEGRQQDYN